MWASGHATRAASGIVAHIGRAYNPHGYNANDIKKLRRHMCRVYVLGSVHMQARAKCVERP